MKKILIKYENLLKRIFTFKIFNSDEIGRTQYLIYLGLIGLTDFTFGYFTSEKPFLKAQIWVRFLLPLLFLLIFIFPVVLLKRLRFLYGDKINFKEFYILGIRSFKINKSSIDIYSLTLLLFILMLSNNINFLMGRVPSLDFGYLIYLTYVLSLQIASLTTFITEIKLLLFSTHYNIDIFLSAFYISKISFFTSKISALVQIYFVYLIFPSGKKNKNQN